MKLSEIIDVFIAGDWGNESSSLETPHAVFCVRGADIVPISNNEFANIPLRYVSDRSFQQKLLQVGDIVIEKSGGSPTQSTGRAVYISEKLLSASKDVVCSNFCQSFRMKRRVFSEYFYYLWKNLYDNDNMFNFEGKTSGIKNFQIDVFLANHWFEPLKELIEAFHAVVSKYHLMIDQNIIENNNLTKRREELLPLLMNGQASVNYDLSHD